MKKEVGLWILSYLKLFVSIILTSLVVPPAPDKKKVVSQMLW